MIPYLLHIAILLSGGYIFYKIFLEKETFFQVNRWILLLGILIVVALPFLQIPVEWSLRNSVIDMQKIETAPPVKHDASDHEALAKKDFELPVSKVSPAEIERTDQHPAQTEALPAVDEKPASEKFMFSKILLSIYFIGLAIFAFNFFIQLSVLFYQICTRQKIKEGELRIVKIKKNKAPFSFWNWIFINPSEYDWETYQQILRHEQIHVLEKHSLDIILAEILVIVQWFNPFAWLYRKAVENNLEYLTDQKILHRGTNRQVYQMSLLRVAVPDLPLQLTTNYNQSFLKKRISMMNAKKSSLSSAWKYLFLIPLLALSVLCLNAVKTNASETFYQEIPEQAEQQSEPQEPIEEPEAAEEMELKEISEPEGVEALEAVEEPVFETETEEETELEYEEWSMSGNWSGSIEGNEVCLTFKNKKSKNHYWHSPDCIAKSAFSTLPTGSEGTFELKGDAGTIAFKGKFTGNEGQGTYAFTENTAFRSYLNQQGYSDIPKRLMFHCVLSGVDKAYLAELKREGFEVDEDNFRTLAHVGPKLADLKKLNQDLKGMGYVKADLDNLLSLTIHEVDTDYIKELRSIGYKDLDLEEVVQASIHEISPEYFRELKAAGVNDLEFEELVQFAIHDVDAQLVQEFKELGFRDMDTEEIVQASIHDIDAGFIRSMHNLGFKEARIEELVQAKIHDVDAAYIKEQQAKGKQGLSLEEYIQLKVEGYRHEHNDEH